jgi:non-canonical (house-cleaning) NTP pyrophosphatase
LALTQINAERGLGAGFCVGLEGGIAQLHGRWFAFGALCIADAVGWLGFGVSPLFELPRLFQTMSLTICCRAPSWAM